MLKIALVGAGSTVFARQLITDILAIDGIDSGEIALVDVDTERLALTHQIATRLIERVPASWRVFATTDRQDALRGSHVVVNTVEVGGASNAQREYEIPRTYGVDQCIGDTIGPGGIFKALRTGPTWLAILRDCERLCPHALVLNYTNPMSILTLAALEGTSMQTVGLCHSVQGTSRRLARYLGIPYEALKWQCAGLNHNAWFTELSCDGEDMYPRLRECAREPAIYAQDPVRFEVMLHFGAFVTESSGHFSEYVPYFRKRPDLIDRYMGEGFLGEPGFYPRWWPVWRAERDEEIREMIAGTREIPMERSHEYAADIIEGVFLDRPRVIYGNVRNTGLIDNLPDGCVEVACLVNRNGVQPCHFGPLPEQLAALNRSHMAVHRLMADALLKSDKQAARYALLLDPLTAAVASPAEIDRMFDELWDAERPWLAAFE